MPTSLNQSAAFALKGSLFTLSVFKLYKIEPESIRAQLEHTLTQAPNFFKNMPLVIDLEEINDDVNFTELCKLLQGFGLIPVGVRAANDTQQHDAAKAGLGYLGGNAKAHTEEKTTTEKPEPSEACNKLVTKPVRSGQQIYVPGGDLIVTASVSPGAEILADGNIHVYGALRGRALAGINGNKAARIFCHDLAAELVSIAGIYKLHDDLSIPDNNGMLEIKLVDDQLQIT